MNLLQNTFTPRYCLCCELQCGCIPAPNTASRSTPVILFIHIRLISAYRVPFAGASEVPRPAQRRFSPTISSQMSAKDDAPNVAAARHPIPSFLYHLFRPKDETVALKTQCDICSTPYLADIPWSQYLFLLPFSSLDRSLCFRYLIPHRILLFTHLLCCFLTHS